MQVELQEWDMLCSRLSKLERHIRATEYDLCENLSGAKRTQTQSDYEHTKRTIRKIEARLKELHEELKLQWFEVKLPHIYLD